MRVIGLTGGIASGKSTVAGMFRDEGIPVVDADRLAREVTRRGRPAYGKIVRAFGPGILLPDGAIDRKKLGEIVFSDPAKRSVLEAITHPAIADGISAALSRLEADGQPVAIVEAALIHETGRRSLCESVISVWCRREQQVARLVARDGISRGQARQRIATQMDPGSKARASDCVIDNSRSIEETRARVRALAARLLAGRL